jgi:hypothetical protein
MSADPYRILGAQLAAAATRMQEARAESTSRPGRWRRRGMNAPLFAAIVVLAGGAIAAAATGILTGSPVPSRQPVAHTGSGAPAAGGSDLLALRAGDPEGGLPWGMRVVHTTRGLTCVQVGRLQRGQLGQLGLDGAFHDDGRFHVLAADVLPTNLASEDLLTCVLPWQSFSFADLSADRGGDPVPSEGVRPPARELRSISFGLLGPKAVSVTYRTSSGLRTQPVSPGSGAYLIVEPVQDAGAQFSVGGTAIGFVSSHAVDSPPLGPSGNLVRAITYRFGSLTCSIGSGAPVRTLCPTSSAARPSSPRPTRDLHLPLHATLVKDTPAACRAAFLNDPCYRVLVRFKAPYSVTSAESEYTVDTKASCANTPIASWAIERDIKRGETVNELSTSSFHPSACSATETLQVRYEAAWLARERSTRPPTIIGSASLRDASR